MTFAPTTLVEAEASLLVAARKRAFTLLELLVATAIFSIVVVAINVVFFAALHLRKSVTTLLDESIPIDRALAILRKDLQNASSPGGVLSGQFRSSGASSGLGSSTTSGSVGSSSVVAQGATTAAATSLAGSGIQGGLDFFTSTGVIRDLRVGGDLQEVNYQLMAPLDSTDALGKDLVRTVTRNLLSLAATTSEEQRLLSNVESLEFEFYDGLQWRDTWDTSLGDTNLPAAVRVRLLQAVAPQRETVKREPLELIVLLRSSSSSESQSDTNSATGGAQ